MSVICISETFLKIKKFFLFFPILNWDQLNGDGQEDPIKQNAEN